MRYYLIGFMGSGKSTYGAKLARALGFEFHDLDEMVEQECGKSVAEIFEQEGEEYFREVEAKMLRYTADLDDLVVATGGGAPCFHDNMEWIKSSGQGIYLKLLDTRLHNRLWKARAERPLVSGLNQGELKEFIREKLTYRSQFYSQADYVIQPEQVNPKLLVELLQADAA